MAAPAVTFADLVEEARRLASEHAGFLAGLLGAITACYVAVDWLSAQSADQGGIGLLSSVSGLVVSIFVQYVATERLLADRIAADQAGRVRRYGSLFGALLLSGMAIGAGMIVLVVPGLYLAGRWFTVSAHLVDKQLGANEALRASWADSENSRLAFSLSAFVSFVPMIVVLGAMLVLESEFLLSDSVASLVVTDLATAVTSVVGWTLAAAAYRLVVPAGSGVEAVFD